MTGTDPNAAAATPLPTLGTTTYSFTRDFHGRRLSFDDIVRRVGSEGLGPGLEVVGFQSFRGWPDLTAAQVRAFHELIDATGLTPTCMGANADAGLRRDRRLRPDELVEYMRAQLEAARMLGFPVVRVQFSVTPDDMERLLPHAERADVRLGMEIHAHHSARHPVMEALLERYEKLGSPHLGFIPDWGSSMRRMPPGLLAAYRTRGLPDRYVQRIEQGWLDQHERGPILDDAVLPGMYQAAFAIMAEEGVGPEGQTLARNSIGLFGHADPADWAAVAPWAVHMHGKFFGFDESGEEPAVPTKDILREFLKAGYAGSISSEWEGWHWDMTSDPAEMIARHHRLERRAMAELQDEARGGA